MTISRREDVIEAATREGWSRRRFRERVLRAAARVVVSARRVTMIIGEAFARARGRGGYGSAYRKRSNCGQSRCQDRAKASPMIMVTRRPETTTRAAAPRTRSQNQNVGKGLMPFNVPTRTRVAFDSRTRYRIWPVGGAIEEISAK